MVVYADVVFIVNFLFNAELLQISHKLQSVKVSPLRLVLSALIGGVASVAVFVPYLQTVCHVAARYTLPFLMSFICRYPCGTKTVIGSGIVLLFVSFCFSGLMNFLGIDAFLGMVLAVPFYVAVCFLSKIKMRKYKEIVVDYRGKTIKIKGLCDSGNFLE
ncbi:MAG: hypothetical protein E7417_04005, partial [Ruminococcaceae bacterium]|nr:hypothetical protein [Oscillospiraceae bacterium]